MSKTNYLSDTSQATPEQALHLLLKLAEEQAKLQPDPPEPLPPVEEIPGLLERTAGTVAGGGLNLGASAVRGSTEALEKIGVLPQVMTDAGRGTSKAIEDFAGDLPHLEAGVVRDIFSGLGSTVPYLIPPVVGSLLGPAGTVAGMGVSSLLGGSAHLDEQVERRIKNDLEAARAAGSSPEEMQWLESKLYQENVTPGTAAAAAGMGAFEAIPPFRGFRFAGKVGKGVVRGNTFKTLVKAGVKEAGEEAFQEGTTEFAHQALNPEESIDPGAAAYNASIGAVVGGGMGSSQAAGGTALEAFRERRAQKGADAEVQAAAEESGGQPPPPQAAEAIKEDLKNPPAGESAGAEIKDAAEAIPRETAQEVDQILGESVITDAVRDETNTARDETIAEIESVFEAMDETIAPQGETLEILGDSVEEPTAPPVEPEPEPEPEPEAEPDPQAVRDAVVQDLAPDDEPEVQEQIEEAVEAVQEAVYPEELEAAAENLEEVLDGREPIIPLDPQTEAEMADLKDLEEEAAASEGVEPGLIEEEVQTSAQEETDEEETGSDGLPEHITPPEGPGMGADEGGRGDGSKPKSGETRIRDPKGTGSDEGSDDAGSTGSLPEPRGNDRPAGEDRPARDNPRVGVKKDTRGRYSYELPSRPEAVRPRSTIPNLKQALDVLADLSATDREPTASELDALAGYGGWGSSRTAAAFKPYATKADQAVLESLKGLGGEQAVADARASTQNAHYTSIEIARATWNALGATGDLKGDFLEPGAGIGVFAGTIPSEVDPNVKMRMVERDLISSRIAKILHPGDSVSPTDLSLLDEENTVDGVIGNVPFGKGPMYVEGKPFSLHDGVIIKTLKALKPGGLGALVTSRYTLDKIEEKARRKMSEYADLVGAVRLPGSSFEADAGTEVVTDLLVFRKRNKDEDANTNFIAVQPKQVEGEGVRINEFYHNHPKRVLGQEDLAGTMHGANQYNVTATDASIQALATRVERSLQNQLSGVKFDPKSPPATEPPVTMEMVDDWLDAGDRPMGSLVSKDGDILEVTGVSEERSADGGVVKKNEYRKLPIKAHKEKIGRLIELRDGALRISKMQRGGEAPEIWKAEQERVGKILEAFWKKWGPVNKEVRRYKTTTRKREDGTEYEAKELTSVSTPNRPKVFENSSMSVYSGVLEDYDSEKDTAKKSTWLTGEIGIIESQVIEPKGVGDAVILSLTSPDTRGKIDPEWIGEALGITRQEAENKLRSEDIAYYSPAEGWMLKSAFLSGDVKTRLAQAQKANLEEEVAILKENQPGWITASKIDPSMGQAWVKEKWRSQYLTEKTGLTFTIERNPKETGWSVRRGKQGYINEWFQAMLSLGDEGSYSPSAFIRAVMNESSVRVYVGPPDKKVLDAGLTQRINGQIARMNGDFSSWLRREHGEALETEYNEKQNRVNYVPIESPGETYQIPGISRELWPHQHRAVFRQLIDGNMGLFHAVGSGKTATMATIAVEQKRLGLVKKPALIVPLSIQKQFARESQMLFPTARILVADELSEGAGSEKGQSEDIRRFVARASATDWDMVIFNKEQFKRINLSAEAQVRELNIELDEQVEALELAKAQGAGPRTVKQMEAAKDKVEARLNEQQRKILEKRDAGFTFEDTGIDWLGVDEGHNYKNLAVSSAIQEASLVGNQVTRDLKQKIHDLEYRKTPGRTILMATGTPVTNRIAEVHTMMRYLSDSRLRSMDDMHQFENWRRQFSEVSSRVEQKSTGDWKPTSRLKFNNLTPLQRYLWSISDIVTEDELEGFVKRPEKTSLNQFAEVDSRLWTKFMDWIRSRYDSIQRGKPIEIEATGKMDNHLMLFMDALLASVDMRFIDDTLPENPNGMLPKAANQIAEIYHSTAEEAYLPGEPPGGVQIVFIDHYKRESWGSNFDAIKYLNEKMIAAGVKEEHIGLVRDMGSDRTKRQALFDRVNRGDIRVILGNTKTMGEGVNIQTRVTDLHHLTVPYRPSDLVQREGRAWRKGNLNAGVRIHRWATKGAMANAWDMIDRKARSWSALISNQPITDRSFDDIGNEVGADEIASVILGSPQLKLRSEVRRKIQERSQEREDMEASWASAQNDIKKIPLEIATIEKELTVREGLIEKIQANKKEKGPYGSFEGNEYDKRDDLSEAITKAVKDIHLGSRPIRFTVRSVPFTAEVKSLDWQGKPEQYYLTIEGLPRVLRGVYRGTFIQDFLHGASYGVGQLPHSVAREKRTLKTIQSRLKSSEKVITKGRQWSPKKETDLQELFQRERDLDEQIASDSEIEAEERQARAQRADEDGAEARVGRHFSVGPGLRVPFAADGGTRREAEAIVRKIFPHVKGVYFSDAMYAQGPELAASQRAAGLPVTEKAEVAGRAERGQAIVEISLSDKFNPLSTAHHEAYHLARMLLTPQERSILANDHASEEHEAYAYQDWVSGKVDGGVFRQIWEKIRALFQSVGNMLRGRGYDSADKIFDRVTVGTVGARAQQQQMEGEAYSSREEKYLDSTNRTLNEITEEEEHLVKEAVGEDRSSTRMRLDWLFERMQENLYSEDYLTDLWQRHPTMEKGKLTVEAQTWRHLNQYARHTAAGAASDLKKTLDAGKSPSDEQLAEFSQALELLREVWPKANAMASEIGRALRAFREPLHPMKLDGITKLDDQIRAIRNNQELAAEVVAGVQFSKEEMLELMKQVSVNAEEYGLQTAEGEGTLLDVLKSLREGEIQGLIAQWKSSPKALVDLIDAVLLEEIKHGEKLSPLDWKSTWVDKVMWLYYFSILSSPKTLMRNGLSGAFMYSFAMPAEEAIQAALPIKGSLTFKQWKAGMGGVDTFVSDVSNSAQAFWETWTTGSTDDPIVFEPKEKIEASYVWGKKSGFARSFFNPENEQKRGWAEFSPGRIMMATDVAVKKLASRRMLRQMAQAAIDNPKIGKRINDREHFMREYVENPPQLAQIMARGYARKMTFQEPLQGVGKAISKARNSHPILNLLMPFVQVPWNISRWGLRRVPGLMLMVPRFRHGKFDGWHGWRRVLGTAGPREQAVAIAEQMTGAMIFLVSGWLVSSGMMTSGGPDEPEKKRVWSQVFRPFSILFGDDWWDYSNSGVDIYSGTMAVTASFWEAVGVGSIEGLEPETEIPEKVTEFMHRLLNGFAYSILNKTMMRPTQEFMNFISQPHTREGYLRRQATLPIPNFLKFLSRSAQEHVPENHTLLDEVKASLPMASMSQPPRRDVWGDPLVRDDYQTPEFQRDPVTDRKRRWATELVRLGMGRGRPQKTILGGIRLTPEEYDAWAEMRGQWYFQAINAVMSSGKYGALSDQQRRVVLRRATSSMGLPQAAFLAVMVQSGNMELRKKWISIKRNLGKSSSPGGIF